LTASAPFRRAVAAMFRAVWRGLIGLFLSGEGAVRSLLGGGAEGGSVQLVVPFPGLLEVPAEGLGVELLGPCLLRGGHGALGIVGGGVVLVALRAGLRALPGVVARERGLAGGVAAQDGVGEDVGADLGVQGEGGLDRGPAVPVADQARG